ncbi:MAG: Pycsar system effector family protein [Candidatus Saccharimonadales bacterium]
MKDPELLELLNRNVDFIKQADTKAGYASTVLFVVVGFLISKSALFTDHLSSLACLVLLLMLATLITTVIFRGIFPTIDSSLTKKSNIYFGSIASKSFRQFKKQAEAMSSKTYHAELLAQVYVTSEIAKAKMVNVKRAAFWLLVFVLLTGIATIIAKYY